MSDLNEKIKELKERKKNYQDSAHAIQKLLEQMCVVEGHKMVSDGHDSHYSYEKCEVCGHTERC